MMRPQRIVKTHRRGFVYCTFVAFCTRKFMWLPAIVFVLANSRSENNYTFSRHAVKQCLTQNNVLHRFKITCQYSSLLIIVPINFSTEVIYRLNRGKFRKSLCTQSNISETTADIWRMTLGGIHMKIVKSCP